MKLFLTSLLVCLLDGALGLNLKSLSARSLAATGVPDPLCKTGVISLKTLSKPQSCCAGYCGECSDYSTCKNIRGQDSKNACCESAVYEMRCGNAPANACLKKCSEAVPPCIMDKDVFKIEKLDHNAADDCTTAVSDWRKKADSAIAQGGGGDSVPKSEWDLSGGQDFKLQARIKTTSAGGTIVGKAFADGLWRSGGGSGQGKMVFLRGGKVGMDIGWVGYFSCNKKVNDGQWHDVALKFVKAEGNQYQLFVDDMKTPCSRGLRAIPDNADTSVVIGTAVGHQVANGKANGDMAPDLKGEVTDVSYVKLK